MIERWYPAMYSPEGDEVYLDLYIDCRKPKPPRGYVRVDASETLMCPSCKHIGTFDDYDIVGLKNGMQCLECQEVVEPVQVQPIEKDWPLFQGARA